MIGCKGDGILEYAYSDLHRLDEIQWMSGVTLILFVVDDYSRKLFIYLLKSRAEAIKVF